MDGYWWGVLTPFAIILGILLLYLTGNLFGAIVSWAWKKAHYGLINYRNDEHCGLDVSVAPVTLPSLAGGGRHGRSVHGAG